MLSVLIQIQCPSVELLFSERKSSLRVFISPLLVTYHQPLRKVWLCVVTKMYLTWHQKNRFKSWLCYLLAVCTLASHFSSHPAQFPKSEMAVAGTCMLWFIHSFLLMHSFIHLLCGRHCAKCSECKARHGPCCHAVYIPSEGDNQVITLMNMWLHSLREHSRGIGLYERVERSWSGKMFKEGFPKERKFELGSERHHR